jgi:tetratricopeptide (TPR) repeat protein
MKLWLRAVFAVAAAGCASGASAGFLRAKGLGDRAFSSGRYEEAARAYEESAASASQPRDRAEGLYLEASAYARARSWDRAREVFARLIAEMPKSERAERAAFDLADVEIDAGNADRGYELLLAAVTKHPNNGLAGKALGYWLDRYEQTGGDALKWLGDAEARFSTTELDEMVLYLRAGRLEAASRFEAARDAYVACADRHPYPHGTLFDDTLWHASLLDEKLGQPDRAILHLRSMLAVREPSNFAGSYERPRFSAAQFRIAVLYRDKLGDREAARREFHQLYSAFETSTLRDDALWEEAKLTKADGDSERACALVATLAKDFKTSRYVPCAPSLCAKAPLSSTKSPCHAYLLRAPEDAER